MSHSLKMHISSYHEENYSSEQGALEVFETDQEVTRPFEAHDVVLDNDRKDQTNLDAHKEENAYHVTVQGVKLKDS